MTNAENREKNHDSNVIHRAKRNLMSKNVNCQSRAGGMKEVQEEFFGKCYPKVENYRGHC